MTHSKNPAFNLKAVLHETGIAADTLRAWERRYGLPLPQRTAGGHRLYSQYDIETIKWLILKQTEGLSISRAVDLWQEQTASGLDPLSNSALQTFSPPQLTAIQPQSETNLDLLRLKWLDGCLSFNEADTEQALNQAFALYPVEVVCTEVLQKGLSEIGALWYSNRASVQQEHFASALAIRRLDTLLSASPPPTRTQTILVGCPSHEWHTFTPLLLSLLLRRRGLNVIYLGANVPGSRIDDTVLAVQAEIVVLVAQQLKTAASLMQTAQMLAVRDTTVAYGGRVFTLHDELHRRIPGHFLGKDLQAAVVKIESLIGTPVKNPAAERVSEEYITAVSAFQAHRLDIEAFLNKSIAGLGFGSEVMKTVTEFLGDNIIAAMQLGQISLLDAEIDWVRTLLKANHIPESALHEYMKFFSQSVNLNLNGSGQPIHEWLAGMSNHPELLKRKSNEH